MSMIRDLKRVMGRLTPLEVASTELAEAELERLKAQTAQEYASSMVTYHTRRIDRLRSFLAALSAAAATTDSKGAQP